VSSPAVRRVAARSLRGLVVLCLCTLSAFAEPPSAKPLPSERHSERGYPLIRIFDSQAHQAGAQIFDVEQDARGVLYFASLGGIGVYDGAWWTLLTLPNDSAAIALKSDSKGRLAVGGIGEIGFVRSKGGASQYESLVGRLPESQRDVGEVAAVCAQPNGFLFLSQNGLYQSDGHSLQQVADLRDQKDAPRRCFTLGDTTWLTGQAGLQRFDRAARRLLPPEPLFAKRKVALLFPRGNGQLVVVVQDEGLFTFDGKTATPFAPEVSSWLRNKKLISGSVLEDGRLVITTRVDGLCVLTPDGQLDEIIDSSAGLPDNVLESSFVDREHALWLAFDGPIARIDLTSPVSLLDARRGIKGSPSDVAHWRDQLFVGTSHGLYSLPTGGQSGSSAKATAIPGIPMSAWDLLLIGDEMLIGTERGVLKLDAAGKITPVAGTEELSLYTMVQAANEPQRIWLGAQQGLGWLSRESGSWKFGGLVKGSPQYVSTIVENRGALWCGTVFDGVQRTALPLSANPQFKKFADGETNVFPVDDRVVFVRAKGEILSATADGKVVRDPQLGHISAPRGYFVIAQNLDGDVWVNSRPPMLFRKSARGYAAEGEPLVQVDVSDMQLLRVDQAGVVWFGTDRGLFRYESSAAQKVEAPGPPLIHRVVAGDDRVLYGKAGSNDTAVSLPHGFGRLRIEFGPASYRPGLSYQYKLDPADATWSRWSDEPFVDYTNLHEGNYSFEVRTRSAASGVSPSAVWSFKVLPPWYRTSWMLVLWFALAAGLMLALVRLRTATLRRDAERLRVSIAERTEELRQTVSQLSETQNELMTKNDMLERLSLVDDLTGVSNRRFFQQALTDEWKRAARRKQPLALILLDLDYFKELNDTSGHLGGDACLREIGRYLSATVRRAGDVVSRYGGEEFAILLPASDAEAGRRLAELLRSGISALEMPPEVVQTHVTASCGVASVIPLPGEPMDTLVEKADRALYAAKQDGRDRVRVADETPDSATA
jgi:diguanylate cyclase (GGDEF)-like protein